MKLFSKDVLLCGIFYTVIIVAFLKNFTGQLKMGSIKYVHLHKISVVLQSIIRKMWETVLVEKIRFATCTFSFIYSLTIKIWGVLGI